MRDARERHGALRSGRLRIDRGAVRAEERLGGKFLLSTSDPELSAEDVALGHKNLLEAERSFRELKGALALRPVFHRLEHRIRAHILICWLGAWVSMRFPTDCRLFRGSDQKGKSLGGA